MTRRAASIWTIAVFSTLGLIATPIVQATPFQAGQISDRSTVRATVYAIGDTGPGGGVIFITPSTVGNSTGKYFEARISGVDPLVDRLPGCNNRVTFPVSINDAAIGAGAANTTAIRDRCATDAGNTAANSAFAWAKAQTIGGFSDWFIPNSGEFTRLYAERGNANVAAVMNAILSTLSGNCCTWVSEIIGNIDPNSVGIYYFDKNDGSTINSTSIDGYVANIVLVRSFTIAPDPEPEPAPTASPTPTSSPTPSPTPTPLLTPEFTPGYSIPAKLHFDKKTVITSKHVQVTSGQRAEITISVTPATAKNAKTNRKSKTFSVKRKDNGYVAFTPKTGPKLFVTIEWFAPATATYEAFAVLKEYRIKRR